MTLLQSAVARINDYISEAAEREHSRDPVTWFIDQLSQHERDQLYLELKRADYGLRLSKVICWDHVTPKMFESCFLSAVLRNEVKKTLQPA